MFDIAINKRLKLIFDSLSISQTDFRKEIGVKSKQQVSNWLNLSEKIPEKYLLSVIRLYPNINARWLITGEGEMFQQLGKAVGSGIASEPAPEYSNGKDCKKCIEKEGMIKLLKEQAAEKDEKIYHLQKSVGSLELQLKGDNDSNGDTHHKATG